MRTVYCKLDENRNIVECSMEEAWKFFEDDDNRFIKQDFYYGIKVSTIFLVLAFEYDNEGMYCFETCILGGYQHSDVVKRYKTEEDSLQGHEHYLENVKRLVKEMVRLGSVRRAKKFLINEYGYENWRLRQWFNTEYHKAKRGIQHEN